MKSHDSFLLKTPRNFLSKRLPHSLFKIPLEVKYNKGTLEYKLKAPENLQFNLLDDA